MGKRSEFRIRGFTLIELMVSLVIIAILVIVGATIYRNASKEARAARRASDLNEFAKALEIYKSQNNNKYPVSASWDCAENALAPLKPYYLLTIPKDPRGGCYQYKSSTTGKDYKLRTDPGNFDMAAADFKKIEKLIDPALDDGADDNKVDPGTNVTAWAIYSPGGRTFTGTYVSGTLPSAPPTAPAGGGGGGGGGGSCGNGLCEASLSETCSSCSTDCGPCPTATPSPSPTPTPVPPVADGQCPTSGLITWYKLDSATGGNASVGGSNFNLTKSSPIISFTTPGKIGEAAYFPSFSYLYCTDSVCGGRTGLDPTKITISAWVNLNNTTSSNKYIVTKQIPDFTYILNWDNANQGPYFQIHSNYSNPALHLGAEPGHNIWVMITATFDGFFSKIYLNAGSINNSLDWTNIAGSNNVPIDLLDTGDGFLIGYGQGHLIDEVGVWNRALSPAEISALYNSGAGTTCP